MFLLCVALVILISIPSSGDEAVDPDDHLLETHEDFTHGVLGEEFTATWCQFCPSAAENLHAVYYEDGYEFVYVALICDVNDKAADRMDDYPTATGYPTVEFDGGYREETGGQSDKSNYQQAIEESGERVDTPIGLKAEMHKVDNDSITVNVWMQWEEDGTITNPTQEVYLRAYIVESISRYRNNDGDKYHFGFLDYAFDEAISLDPDVDDGSWEDTITWHGSDHEDANGDDFGDVDYDNLDVIVAVFNDETGQDEYNLEALIAVPPTLTIDDELDGSTVGGDVELEVVAIGNETKAYEISRVEYKINDGDWVEMDEVADDGFEATWKSGTYANGEHVITFLATDTTGTTNMKNATVIVSNDDDIPPEISIIYPEEEEVLSGEVTLKVEATDNEEVQSVQYKIGDDGYEDMESIGDDQYETTWDTSLFDDGEYTITFLASDGVNSEDAHVDIELDNDADPEIEITSPEEGYVTGVIDIIAEVSDDGEIEEVSYKIDSTNWEAMTEDDGEYVAEWNTEDVEDGEHEIWARVIDDAGQEAETYVTVQVDNSGGGGGLFLKIVNPENDELLKENVNIRATADDPDGVDKVEFKVDSGDWTEMDHEEGTTYEYKYDTSALDDDEHTITVRAWNTSGGSTERAVYVETDNNRPEVTIDEPDKDELFAGEFELIIEVEDYSDVSVKYQIDESGWRSDLDNKGSEWTKDIDTTTLDDGEHELMVRAVDEAEWAQTLVQSFYVDNSAPDITFTPEADAVVSGVVDIEATVEDSSDIDAVKYRIDEGTWLDMTEDTGKWVAEWDTDLETNEDHKIEVKAEDEVGNHDTVYHYVTVNNDEGGAQEGLINFGNFMANPQAPWFFDEVTVSVQITDDEYDITTVTPLFTGNYGSIQYDSMSILGDTYSYTFVPGQSSTIVCKFTATNDNGDTSFVQYSLNVVDDIPDADITIEPATINPGSEVEVTIELEIELEIEEAYLVIDGDEYELDGSGDTYSVKFDAPDLTESVEFEITIVTLTGYELEYSDEIDVSQTPVPPVDEIPGEEALIIPFAAGFAIFLVDRKRRL